MFSWGDSFEGVKLLVSKLLVDIDYPEHIISKLKPYMAQKIWNQYELQIRKLKGNLKKKFDTAIRPAKMEEDQQNFVNRYIKRSFIPIMVEILADVLWWLNTHSLVLKFRTDSNNANESNNHHIATQNKHNFSGNKPSLVRSRATLSPRSSGTTMQNEGSTNIDVPLMVCESHLDSPLGNSTSSISALNYSNTDISNGSDILHTNSYPNYRKIKHDDEQKVEFLVK
jgi:hypothetical protein